MLLRILTWEGTIQNSYNNKDFCRPTDPEDQKNTLFSGELQKGFDANR